VIVSESRSVDRKLHAAASRFGRRRRTSQIGIPVLVWVPGLWLWVQLVRTGLGAGWLALFGRTVESGPRSELSGPASREDATRRVPADLAEISRVLVSLAQLTLTRP